MATAYVPYAGPIVTRAEAKAAGAVLFFTGRPCRRGHNAQRYVAQGLCVECARAAADKQRRDDPERHKVALKAWQKANKEKYHANATRWTAAHLEWRKAYEKAWRTANREKITARTMAWRAANRERWDAAAKAWHEANRPRVRTIWRNRRARTRNAAGKHTVKQILDLLQKQQNRCAACSKSLKPGYHADHIMPLARGGSNDIGNIQLLCVACNLSKGQSDPIEWAQKKGRLL